MKTTQPLTKTYDACHASHAMHQHLRRRVQGHAVSWIYKKARVPRNEVWSPCTLALHFFNTITTDQRALVGGGGGVLSYELTEWQRQSIQIHQDFNTGASMGPHPGRPGRELTVAWHATLSESCGWGLAALAVQVMRDSGGWLISNVRPRSALERAIQDAVAAALQSRWDTGAFLEA